MLFQVSLYLLIALKELEIETSRSCKISVSDDLSKKKYESPNNCVVIHIHEEQVFDFVIIKQKEIVDPTISSISHRQIGNVLLISFLQILLFFLLVAVSIFVRDYQKFLQTTRITRHYLELPGITREYK